MIREWNEESLDHRNTLLYAMGISEEDAKRPIIGLLNTWNEMNPGHFPFDKELIAEMKNLSGWRIGFGIADLRYLRRDLQQYTGRSLYVAGKRYGVKRS